jgi:hypothetical protein
MPSLAICALVPFNQKFTSNNHSSLALLLSLLHDLLDNLLFFNQECANNAVLDAVGTSGTAVGTLNGLLRSGDAGIFARTQSRDLSKYLSTIALLCDEGVGRWSREPSVYFRLRSIR